jgi:hypothetical protein
VNQNGLAANEDLFDPSHFNAHEAAVLTRFVARKALVVHVTARSVVVDVDHTARPW